MIVIKASVILLMLHLVQGQTSIHGLGLLIAELPDEVENAFCIRYYPRIYNFTADRKEAKSYFLKDLLDLKTANSCDENDPNIPENLTDKFAFARYVRKAENSSDSGVPTNCTILDRARIILQRNGSGLLVDSALSMPKNETPDFSLPVAALFDKADRDELLALIEKYPEVKFLIYAPDSDEKRFDASLVVILFMAVFTIMVGSFWSGMAKNHLRNTQLETVENEAGRGTRGPGQDDEERICEAENSGHPPEEVSLRISPVFVLVFVVLMCTMLVLLYFFFDKLVYVIIAMFCLASTIAVYSCFEPLVMYSYEAFPRCPTLRLPRCNMYICVANLEFRQFILLACSVSVTTVWAVFRNENWAWIIQDILGILFSINMLKVLRLPSFKICTILLSALFIYDIFFVFITPLITKDGKSIMVEVATGGDTGEQLPMVLKVPHLGSNPLKVCWMPYSMLGFGDILVPGLLLSYCHSFDLLMGTPYRLYWILTSVAYTLGLVATFVSLFLMNSAQPALLYLVPFTLIPVFIVSFLRGDLAAMWQGDYEPTAKEHVTPEDQREAGVVAEDGDHGEGEQEPSIRNPEERKPKNATRSQSKQAKQQ